VARFLSVFALSLFCSFLRAEAQEQVPVAIELVLALDSSASVDSHEFKLQLEGLALALRDSEVTKAVDNLAPLGVAIAIIQWGGKGDTKVMVPFLHLQSARDSKALGFLVSRSFRMILASDTSIASAINDAHQMLDTNLYQGQRRVVDISGDGPDNGGVDIEAARQSAKSASIVVNGLPIASDDGDLADYYAKRVIIGPNSFVEPANDFDDFARAIRAKLLKELQPLAS
jgi:hypothetical protein